MQVYQLIYRWLNETKNITIIDKKTNVVLGRFINRFDALKSKKDFIYNAEVIDWIEQGELTLWVKTK